MSDRASGSTQLPPTPRCLAAAFRMSRFGKVSTWLAAVALPGVEAGWQGA